MEIKKITVNIAKQRLGVIQVYWIPEQTHNSCGNIVIDEYQDRYELINVKGGDSIDQYDLSDILFEFIKSPYYHEKKVLYYLGNAISFTKEDEYTDVFQKLNPAFEKN